MIIKDLVEFLEQYAPLSYQEDYDNAGLIVGNPKDEIKSGLVCLDCTEQIIDEAILKKCDIVIAHHPIIFKGLKKLNGKNYIERVIIKAIKNNIAIYAIHTNLDNVINGVNDKICDKIGLINRSILAPKKNNLKKLATYIPINYADVVKEAIIDYHSDGKELMRKLAEKYGLDIENEKDYEKLIAKNNEETSLPVTDGKVKRCGVGRDFVRRIKRI